MIDIGLVYHILVNGNRDSRDFASFICAFPAIKILPVKPIRIEHITNYIQLIKRSFNFRADDTRVGWGGGGGGGGEEWNYLRKTRRRKKKTQLSIHHR